MRTASLGLQQFLQAGCPNGSIGDVFNIILNNGTTFRYTSFDIDITDNSLGYTWYSSGIQIDRSTLNYKNTIEVPECNVTINVNPNMLYNGTAFLLCIHNGLLDGGRLQIARYYMPSPGDTSLGQLVLFNGRISELTLTATGVDLTVKGDNVLFNQQIPHNVYQGTCIHAFCDPGCTLLQSAYTITGQTVLSSGFNGNFGVAWNSYPSNYTDYNYGSISFTSGVLEGTSATISDVGIFSGACVIFPTYPFAFVPNAGDTFSVLQGCNKTLARCKSLLSNSGPVDNSQHIRLFPYVPPPESAF